MLVAPSVGLPLVLYAGEGNRRIITSPAIRVMHDPTAGGIYVQTGNALYVLQRNPREAPCTTLLQKR